MKKIATILLSTVAAIAFVSCDCPRCAGSGYEVAVLDGVHPYTNRQYYEGEQIPCLRCGGTGGRHNQASSARFSATSKAGKPMIHRTVSFGI